MCKLPKVTLDTMESLDEIFGDTSEPDKKLMNWLSEMQDENPVVADLLRDWIKVTSNGTHEDMFRLLRGPIFIYQMLKVQAEVDSVVV